MITRLLISFVSDDDAWNNECCNNMEGRQFLNHYKMFDIRVGRRYKHEIMNPDLRSGCVVFVAREYHVHKGLRGL